MDRVFTVEMNEGELHTVECAVENLRSPTKDNPITIDAAWRIASDLERLTKKLNAALRSNGQTTSGSEK